MGRFEHTAVVAAPPDRVWNAVVEHETRLKWGGAEIVRDATLREGSTITFRTVRDQMKATVVAMRPPERLTLLYKPHFFTRIRRSYELAARGDDTEVTISDEFSRLGGWLIVGRSLREHHRRSLEDEVARIKAAVEGQGRHPL